jgi:hypothetical protein
MRSRPADGRLPTSFGRLPADDQWTDVRAAFSARAASTVPAVFVSTVPAERTLCAQR